MSIEPHASPTVEAVASLQKEAERVKPGNHVEQVKTESETLETVAAFGGLPMGDLIARPVLEASKAQQALAEGEGEIDFGRGRTVFGAREDGEMSVWGVVIGVFRRIPA